MTSSSNLFLPSETQGKVSYDITNSKLILGNNSIDGLVLNNSGNIGIGSTTPNRLLELYKSSGEAIQEIKSANNNSLLVLNSNIGLGGTGNDRESRVTFQEDSVTKATLGYAPDFSAFGIATGSGAIEESQFFLTDSGYVGVGVTNPSRPLQIDSGDNQGANIFITDRNNTGNNIGIAFAHGENDNGMRMVWNDSSRSLVFQTSDQDGGFINNVMAINENGNVGIGTVLPDTLLTLGSGATEDGDVLLKFNTDRAWQFEQSGNDSAAQLVLKSNVSGKFLYIRASDDSNVATFHANSSGSNAVGIGTNNPAEKLDIRGTTDTKINLRGTSDTGSARIDIGCNNTGSSYPLLYLGSSGSNGWCEINSRFTYPLVFLTGNTERIRILSNGDVGIGTDTPGRKLEVNGDITHKNSVVIRRRTATQTISNNTDTAIQFNIGDTTFGNDITVTSNTDYTINTDGLYQVEYTLSLSTNATGVRAFYISINGTTDRYAVYTIPGNSTNPIRAAGSALINLSASDIVRIYVWQNSGSSLTVAGSTILTARLTIYRVGDNY